MSLNLEKKSKVIKQFARSETDTGSPVVQIALLTENILALQIKIIVEKSNCSFAFPSQSLYIEKNT